ncbi:MAG: NAD-dependent epimerase/dehydratase family protein [Oscillospiraceae bacterium]|nr:NAD-dependent epimerase/dehydratase family protein [Oscillospiraceae bacterium]
MKKLLITGGTNFVSRYAAEYFVRRGYAVTVLNRNSRPQVEGVTLVEADRHDLGDCLRGLSFDGVLDITAYTGADVAGLLDALDGFGTYILVSSSAVYPENQAQPLTEEREIGPNGIWGIYGTNKVDAERVLQSRVPGAYILRPPYLYGPGNNVYREAFVFDCAMEGRKFYLPGDGKMKLQFFHVDDLCRFMELLLEKKPQQRIFNVGNPQAVSVREWAELCYRAAGKEPEFVSVDKNVEQRRYFPFYDYEYFLDVEKQLAVMPRVKPLEEGLREALEWYRENRGLVNRKPLIAFIDENL